MALEPLLLLAGNTKLGPSLEDYGLHAPPEGGAERTFELRVDFERPFTSPPVVHVGITGFDITNADAARVAVRVRSIDARGFTLVASTWLSTAIWSLDLTWLALGR